MKSVIETTFGKLANILFFIILMVLRTIRTLLYRFSFEPDG